MVQRHIPLRSCAGCGEKTGKRGLVRIVRTPSGAVGVDPSGKANGRGAYLCTRFSCWQTGLKKGHLEHALRGPIPPESRLALLAYMQGLKAQDMQQKA